MRPHHPIDEALLERLPSEEVVAADEQHKPLGAKVKVEQSGAVPDLLEALALVEERDGRAEKMAPIMKTVAWLAVVSAFIAVFFVVHVPAGIVLAIVAAGSFVAAAAYRSEDVSDRQLATICTVLSTFASELRPGRAVDLFADFKGLAKTRGLNDGDKKVYRHPWLRLELPLADGSLARVQVTSSMKRKSKRKRKYTKHKDQLSDQLTVEIIPPKGKKLSVDRNPPRPQVRGLALTRAQVKPRQAVFSFRSQAPLRRLHGRMGWSLMNEGHLVDGHKVVAALIQSYKATATSNRGAAA